MAKSIVSWESVLPQVVADIVNVANNATDKWQKAVVSRNFSVDGTSMEKLRILRDANEDIGSESASRPIRKLIGSTWEKLHKKKTITWYGFKLTVYPDGRHDIEYNDDPNCIDDPNFVDW